MSQIQSALERAKRQRMKTAAAVSQALSPAPLPLEESSPNIRDLSMADLPRVIPDPETLAKHHISTAEARNPAEGAYRMIRTRLMRRARSNGWRILGVSSLGPNEGKTFTAINLAVYIAAEVGQEALLIDLDLRRPSVHDYLGLDPSQFTGIGRYMSGETQDLRELLVSPSVDRLGCLLTPTPFERPSDVLGSATGKRLFQELRDRLPLETMVIVDLPPLLAVDDALAVAPMLDGLIFVVAEGHTKRADLVEAQSLLREFNLVGTVLNKSQEKDSRKNQYY